MTHISLKSFSIWRSSYVCESVLGAWINLVDFFASFDKDTTFEPPQENSNKVACATTKGLDQPAHMCSLIRAFVGHLDLLVIVS